MARGPAHVAYRILQPVTDRYNNLAEGLERGIDVMEDEMFENPRKPLLEEPIAYDRNLNRLRRIFNCHKGLFERLAGSPSCGRPRPSKSGKAWRRVLCVLAE